MALGVTRFGECLDVFENRPFDRLNFGKKVTLRETKLVEKATLRERIFDTFPPTLRKFFKISLVFVPLERFCDFGG